MLCDMINLATVETCKLPVNLPVRLDRQIHHGCAIFIALLTTSWSGMLTHFLCLQKKLKAYRSSKTYAFVSDIPLRHSTPKLQEAAVHRTLRNPWSPNRLATPTTTLGRETRGSRTDPLRRDPGMRFKICLLKKHSIKVRNKVYV